MRRWILVFLFLSAVPAEIIAAGKPGRSGAAFLRVPVGARAVGMGESFSAASDDALSLFWNPAALGPLRTPEVQMGHLVYFGETRIDSLVIAYPTLWGGFAAGTRWFTGGGIPRLQNGEELGNFRSVERTAEFAAAFGKRNFSLGFLGKYYQHRLDDRNIDALLSDVGALKTWRKGRYRIGVVGQNLGDRFGFGSSEEMKAPPPRLWRGGFAFRASDRWVLSTEYLHPEHYGSETHAGVEHWLVPEVGIRFGYLWAPHSERQILDPIASWRFGMGLRMGPIVLDYAYAPGHVLGDIHHASLGYRFFGLTELEEAGRVTLNAQPGFFSPNGDSRKDTTFFLIGTEGVEHVSKWIIDIRNSKSKRVVRFSGRGNPPGLTEWNGWVEGQSAQEDEYIVQSRIWGRSSQALSRPVRLWLDRTSPVLRVSASTAVFTPDGDGSDDEVVFHLRGQDKSPLSYWAVSIGDLESEVLVASGTFHNGVSSFTWTGRRNLTGEAVPNGVYEARFTAYDAADNSSQDSPLRLEVSASIASVLDRTLKGLHGRKTEDGYIIVLAEKEIFEDPGSSSVAEKSLPLRLKIVSLAKALSDHRIIINGYSGAGTTPGKRLEVSSSQAWSLYSALVKSGVPALRLEVHGLGGKKNTQNRLEILFVRAVETEPEKGEFPKQ